MGEGIVASAAAYRILRRFEISGVVGSIKSLLDTTAAALVGESEVLVLV